VRDWDMPEDLLDADEMHGGKPMLHKLGYDYQCEECQGWFAEADLAPFEALLCEECWENLTVAERQYYEDKHHA